MGKVDKKLFLIKNLDTGEYLVWRAQLLQIRKGYFWKDDKAGAAIFNRHQADKVCATLKRANCFNIKKVRVKK